MNVGMLLEQTARRNGHWTAVSQDDRSWSYAQFFDRVARTANFMRSQPQVRAGDRVGIAMENDMGTLQVMYACWHAGLCAIPINAKLHPREFAYILEHSQARLCFASPALYDGIRDAVSADIGLRIFEAAGDFLETVAQSPPTPLAECAPDTPAWLFYTSGTTGRPKGATISHRNLMCMSQAYLADIDQVRQHDMLLHAAPLSHASGLCAVAFVARGGHNRVLAHFSTGVMLEAIERYRSVSFFGAPTLLVRLMNDGACSEVPRDHLKTIIYGGGPMYVSDLERAIDCFGPCLYQTYGQGESPMTITGLDQAAHADHAHPRFRARLASCGYARTGVDVRVVDADDRDMPVGEIGEIITRSDCRMLGYLNNPQANEQALREGWLHTGDLGTMDEDGLVTLRDRSKDLIISGGTNIYPREIEEVLLNHPEVAQIGVVAAPHPEWGEEVVAFVVRAPGSTIDAVRLDELCLAQIARFKRPKRYLFVDDLPKNNYGKVLKTELRRLLEAGSASR